MGDLIEQFGFWGYMAKFPVNPVSMVGVRQSAFVSKCAKGNEKKMRKIILIKNVLLWSFFSIVGVIAAGKYISLFVADVRAGEEVFIPGALALGAGILLFLAFAVTRVIKYAKAINTP